MLVQTLTKQKIWEHDEINLPAEDILDDVDDISNTTIEDQVGKLPNLAY